ncbi:MAG: hypothetical protein O3A36_02530 [bacterium]|nr:hypothetical protein [bacterium]
MKKNQGSAVIYIVLLLFVMMTSAAIVLTTILSKHVRAAENYVSTERSFAAANSSIEEILYSISKGEAMGVIKNEDSINYGNGVVVTYKGEGCVVEDSGKIVPHITASGIYKGAVRRIDFGRGEGECRNP